MPERCLKMILKKEGADVSPALKKMNFLLAEYKKLVLVNFGQINQSIDFTTIINIDHFGS